MYTTPHFFWSLIDLTPHLYYAGHFFTTIGHIFWLTPLPPISFGTLIPRLPPSLPQNYVSYGQPLISCTEH